MSKQWLKPILEMLRDSGSIELPHGGDHRKFRLPNGYLFVISKTPSAPSAVDNAMAVLRRELRSTHPEIAMRGRNLSKEKMEKIMVVNKPGDTPKPLYENWKNSSVTYTELAHWPKEFPTPIPHTEEAFETKMASINIRRQPIRIEDEEMLSILERARQALEETKKLLASFNEQIVQLKIKQDVELERQIKLEEYIKRQEAIALEAQELIDFGMIPAEPTQQVKPKKEKGKRAYPDRVPRDLMQNSIIPDLRLFGGEFTPEQMVNTFKRFGYERDQRQLSKWLSNEVRRNPDTPFTHLGTGRYGFKTVVDSADTKEYSEAVDYLTRG